MTSGEERIKTAEAMLERSGFGHETCVRVEDSGRATSRCRDVEHGYIEC